MHLTKTPSSLAIFASALLLVVSGSNAAERPSRPGDHRLVTEYEMQRLRDENGQIASNGLLNSLSGTTWRPDRLNIDPLSGGATFDAAGRSALLSGFTGLDPNGSWTLFIADVSSGEQSQWNSWELDITTVPEPVNSALGIFGAVSLCVWVCRGSRTYRTLIPVSTPCHPGSGLP